MASVIETVNLVDAGEAADEIVKRVGDEIVKRLHSSELPEDIGQCIREIAKLGAVYFTAQLGYGATPFMLDSTFLTDGSLRLVLSDYSGLVIWRTTLKAPPPAPRQVHITHEVQCSHDGRGDDC